MSETTITESCGCVFCDLGLDPDNSIGGRAVHMHRDRGAGYSFCTCDAFDPDDPDNVAPLPLPPETGS